MPTDRKPDAADDGASSTSTTVTIDSDDLDDEDEITKPAADSASRRLQTPANPPVLDASPTVDDEHEVETLARVPRIPRP